MKLVLGAVLLAGGLAGAAVHRLDAGMVLSAPPAGGGGAPTNMVAPYLYVTGPVALNTHAIGAAGASSATSAPVTVASVAPNQIITGFFYYCPTSSCTTGAVSTPSSVTGTLGDTCTYVSAASTLVSASNVFGVGAFACTGITGQGSDTVTVTMPSAVAYMQLWAQSWSNATKIDTACSKNNSSATATTTWTVTSGTAAVTGTAPVSFVMPIGSSGSTTTTNGTLLDDDGKGRISSNLVTQATTGPFTMNGNTASSLWIASILCASP